MQLVVIVLTAVLTENFVLSKFLGICPFLGVSKRVSTAFGMSAAVLFVMTMAGAITFAVSRWILQADWNGDGVAGDLAFLQTIAFILVIASLVQLTEMAIQKLSPALYSSLGIFLPLITTNCAILAVALFQTARDYSFAQSLVFALGAGGGFMLALVLMASLRERLQLANVPTLVQGTALSLILAGLLSLTFMGFAGMGSLE
ncbi:MAG: RnfABCDGE type electron transport complex subunit A [Gammaproteobacteria bacterium]|nr:RnfABCDGE type electron transport complex subunit A [Gammaproteobacteria bacterium]